MGSATAASGTKAAGFLQVPAGSDAALSIPVVVVNGAKPGPLLALTAGAQGTEYASVLALQKVAQSLDPAAIAGAVVIVPLLNPASFQQKIALNPVDGKNMNRYYPGKADGSQTERAAWVIGKQVVEKCDFLIDYHSAGLDGNIRHYSYWIKTGKPKTDSVSRDMVLAFGLDHIVIRSPGGPVTITRYAQDLVKPAIIVYAGHSGIVEAGDLDALTQGTASVMRYLKMLPGEAKLLEHALWLGNLSVISSERDGVFFPMAVPEGYVKQGMPVGYIADYFGAKIADVVSPVTGVVVYINSAPSMKKGDILGYIGELSEEPR